MKKLVRNENFKFERTYPKISSYTTTLNCVEQEYPFVEAIKSFLGFSNEVVVLDGCSTDGTWEILEQMSRDDDRIKIYQNEFNWQEPGVDGLQKAYARALCEGEILVQFDVDEIAHEADYEKWKLVAKRFPKDADILHLPVVELWGDEKHCTTRRHVWKWRMSRNKPEITHGINKHARITNEQTGVVYAKKGMSDGCEYVNAMTYDPLSHVGFYNQNYEIARMHMPEDFAKAINNVVNILPSVWHTSWMDIPRKLKQLQPSGVWDRMWSLLYQEETQNRFSDVNFSNQEQVDRLVTKLIAEGGELGDQVKGKFLIDKTPPKLLQDWVSRKK